MGAKPAALEGVEGGQKMHTPRDTPWYFNNYYGMAGANTFVHTGYTQNSYSLPDNGNTIMARVFRLPEPTIGDVTLNETDALVEVDLGFQSATGDGYWTGKYLAITFSNPNGNPKVGKFVIWEINNSNATPITPAYVIAHFRMYIAVQQDMLQMKIVFSIFCVLRSFRKNQHLCLLWMVQELMSICLTVLLLTSLIQILQSLYIL